MKVKGGPEGNINTYEWPCGVEDSRDILVGDEGPFRAPTHLVGKGRTQQPAVSWLEFYTCPDEIGGCTDVTGVTSPVEETE